MGKCIQSCCGLNVSDGNPNIAEYNISGSLRQFARTQTNKNVKRKT